MVYGREQGLIHQDCLSPFVELHYRNVQSLGDAVEQGQAVAERATLAAAGIPFPAFIESLLRNAESRR